jgi:alpha-glucoside transport system substrate-binding protein
MKRRIQTAIKSTTFGVTVRLAAAGALIAVVALFGGPSGAAPGAQAPSAGVVTVIASWTGTALGTEGYDFQQVLNKFTATTGIAVRYTGTRGLDQLLQSDIQQGSPPDLAILPSPGELLQLEEQGYLYPLSEVLSKQQTAAYGPQWQKIMKLGTGQLYTLPIKTDLQNLVWYDPQDLPAGIVPSQAGPIKWSQLLTLESRATARGGAVWCLGLDSPPTSGWPATDWIADILLAQSGTSVYQRWADGKLPWTSSQVEAAWQTWGSLVTGPGRLYGGSIAALISPWYGPEKVTWRTRCSTWRTRCSPRSQAAICRTRRRSSPCSTRESPMTSVRSKDMTSSPSRPPACRARRPGR